MADILDRALIARVPALVKARAPEASGRRIVDIEASTEEVDLDGDVVLQSALLNSAESFVATGHLDIDHKSEIGHRMVPPVLDPASYVVGRPLSVRNGGGGRTFVEGEISRPAGGASDPAASKADELWESLRRDPPVLWYASIYGFPLDTDDCTRGGCAVPATRLLVKAIDWRSLAFTRTPKNTAIGEPVRIVSVKAYIAGLAKAVPDAPAFAWPDTLEAVVAAGACKSCGVQEAPSLLGYQRHFEKCMGYPKGAAGIAAHALSYKRNMDGILKSRLACA